MKPNALIIFVFVCFLSFVSKSQTITSAPEKKAQPINQDVQLTTKSKVADENAVKVKDNLNFNEGTIPTPEEQGFTKQIIDGKDTYFKEEGQIMIQYVPKK